METVTAFIFLGSKITADGDCSHEIKRHLLLGRKARVNLGSILKSRDITLPTKVRIVSYGFSRGHVWMWELDHNEAWVSDTWCFWTLVLEKILESPLDCREIKPVNPKGNQSWMFTGMTDTEVLPWGLKELDVTEWLDNNRRTCGFDPWVGKIPRRRAWQHIPVLFPGECHWQRSLVGYGPRVTESNMTEVAEYEDEADYFQFLTCRN